MSGSHRQGASETQTSEGTRTCPRLSDPDAVRPVPRHVHHGRGRRGIAIIDQHVAHERVLFERITERLTAARLESQRLLEPMLVEMSRASIRRCWLMPGLWTALGSTSRTLVEQVLRLVALPAVLDWSRCEVAFRRCG